MPVTDISQRQITILKAIVEEYMETAMPVGSEKLDKKFSLGVSPATIRNEMVKLTAKGFLRQVHTSAGRSPTPVALKYYVNNLLKPKELSVAEEVAVKEKVWDHRHELDKLLSKTSVILADRTKALALVTTEEGDLYYAGAAHILEMPEFYNIELARSLLLLLEEFNFWKKLFYENSGEEEFRVIVGDELGEEFEQCGIVCTRFKIPGHGQGAIGVIGSNRLDYGYVIPVVRYIGHLLTELSTY